MTDAVLETRTIPESDIFLRDVPRIAYADRFGDGGEIAARTSLRSPVLILENDGVQVVGPGVL